MGGGVLNENQVLAYKNFRSCKDVHIEFESMHSLVGSGDAGKSTILRALDFFFNHIKPDKGYLLE